MKLPQHLDKYALLYVYDELTESQKQEFEAHLKYNAGSQQRVDEIRAFHSLLAERETVDPSEAQLESARANLRHRLREERRQSLRPRWWENLRLNLSFRPAPGMVAFAAVLFFIGIQVGRFLVPPGAEKEVSARTLPMSNDMPAISDVDLIRYEPKSGIVSVQYRALQDVSLRGNIKDEAIRKVLTHAIMMDDHPGRRLMAIKATGGAVFSDHGLEDALIHAMERDEVAGVRLRAAKVLRHLSMNPAIKHAFIRVLLKDPNPAMRIEALDVLSGVKETDVRPIFQSASREDDNEFVRLRASQVLERTKNPEVDDSRSGNN